MTSQFFCRYCSCRLCICYVIDLQLWWSPLGFDSCVVLSCVILNSDCHKNHNKSVRVCLPIIWNILHTQQSEVTKNAVFHTTGSGSFLKTETESHFEFLTNQFLSIFDSFKKTKHQDSIICASCVRVVRPKKTICSYSYTIWKTTRGEKWWASDSFWRGPPRPRDPSLWSCWSAAIYCIGIHYNKRQK